MSNDISIMNPKGHVKLELYNDEGVFYTKEKKNLVVQSANRIVAEMMANPAKLLRISQKDKGLTSVHPNRNQLYAFQMTVKSEEKVTFENNWGSSNEETIFEVEELKDITSVDFITVGGYEKRIDEEIFIKDASLGKIEFVDPPKDTVSIHFHKINNPYMKIIEGTESVKVNGEVWKKSLKASAENKTYQIDYRTGEILFDKAQVNVEVSYDYHMKYSLGFMGLGGKPNEQHPDHRPVEFGNSQKLETIMHNELEDSRVPVQFPASISLGAVELEPAIPTQPIAVVLKTKDDLEIIANAEDQTKVLAYSLPNKHDSGSGNVGRTLHAILSVNNITQNAEIDLTNITIKTNHLNKVEVEFRDEDVAIGDVIKVTYQLKLDNRHLIYQLGQAPVVQLVSVYHTDAVTGKVSAYNIVDEGVRPNQGDVWISNPSTGHIAFSANPTGGPTVETPGQIQVTYRINSGTIVKFVADFPKGVPGPVLEGQTVEETIISGQTTIILDRPIAKDERGTFILPEITVTNDESSTILDPGQYDISVDGQTISIGGLTEGDEVVVKYKCQKTTHDIYQVAMFDDKVGGNMFNISGIGPVTKDKDTGMRISWSVTF